MVVATASSARIVRSTSPSRTARALASSSSMPSASGDTSSELIFKSMTEGCNNPGSTDGPDYLADDRSEAKSPTGPRCVSLSGLTIPLMLADLTAGEIERTDADQLLLTVEQERSRTAVDLDHAERRRQEVR